jgi:hypothetical protein
MDEECQWRAVVHYVQQPYDFSSMDVYAAAGCARKGKPRGVINPVSIEDTPRHQAQLYSASLLVRHWTSLLSAAPLQPTVAGTLHGGTPAWL